MLTHLPPAVPVAFTSAKPNRTIRHIRWAPLNAALSSGHELQRIKESDSIDFVLSAGFIKRVESGNRATNAVHLEIDEHAYRSRPAAHDLVDRHVGRRDDLFHSASLKAQPNASLFPSKQHLD